MSDSEHWSIQDSAALYGLDRWGDPYFSINGRGHISVQPQGDRGGSLDLVDLVSELKSRNLALPLLIRFDDILEDRLERLHAAFERAIAQYSYPGRYQGVFPVKCNQQRHVVEELVSCGKRWNFGLEAGSKAELLIALSLLDDPEALLICNGYKDRLYIETAILARRLGRQPVVVIEQPDEVDRIIEASKSLGAAPYIGVRAKLSSRSTGRWGSSVGDKAKFGLSIPELLAAVERLRENNLLPDLRLLHFHIGSQINDIAVLKDALQEAGQIYVELTRLGAPMGFLDVGGGLGIDYDGSRTASAASTNYSLQNYANDVVATVRECCEPNGVAVPTLVSESGRAIASHFSLLVFDVLGSSALPASVPKASGDEPLTVRNLRDTLATIQELSVTADAQLVRLQEAWNDALKFKQDALAAFRLGYMGLPDRATAEQLTWACADAIAQRLPKDQAIPEELAALNKALAGTYYANLSIFRSAPDTWAIDQLFPVVPIQQLDQRPTRLVNLADLTCDSDGRIDHYVDGEGIETTLPLPEDRPGEPLLIGFFMTGAYQEILGDMHNLFGDTHSVDVRLNDRGGYDIGAPIQGDTVAKVLRYVNFEPERLLEAYRHKFATSGLPAQLQETLLAELASGLEGYTYLED